jgi:hypothetical protein
MTLHCHKVDNRTLAEDGDKPVHVPSGFEIAPGDADDIRVCASHPWQSCYLIFSNGDVYGTPMHPVSSSIGTIRSPLGKKKFLTHENREKSWQRRSYTGKTRKKRGERKV